MTYISLTPQALAFAAALVLLDAALSFAFRLGMGRIILIAALRMMVQLSLLTGVLVFLFSQVSGPLTALAAVAMALFAAREASARQSHPLQGGWSFLLGSGAITLAAGLVAVFALTTQVRPDPWYHPQYSLPLLGMILGNTMNAVSLALDTLTGEAENRRMEIESRLALGAPTAVAFSGLMRRALKVALTPIVNAMSTIGLVAIPGMMTGQILAGADPVDAARYQVLVMFLIAGGTGFGALIVVLTGVRRSADDRCRLRLDRLRLKR